MDLHSLQTPVSVFLLLFENIYLIYNPPVINQINQIALPIKPARVEIAALITSPQTDVRVEGIVYGGKTS